MPTSATLLAFVVASLVLIAVPGPNLIYIVTRSASQGRRAGMASAFGVESGTLIHVAAAALGLSSLVAASPVLFGVVRYAGAGYLIYLGVRTLRRPSGLDAAAATAPAALRRVYLDGMLVNLLNPKVVVFFLAFVPQFVSPGAGATLARTQMLVFGAVMLVIGLTTDLCYALAGAATSRWLRGSSARRRWQRFATAAVYLGLGAFAALPDVTVGAPASTADSAAPY